MTTLSVVIVTRNRKEELTALLEDLSRLPFAPGDGVLVVDNGSLDGTPQRVRERFPAVKLLALKENVGAPAARNAGAGAACGDWLVFLDDDTRIDDSRFPDRLRDGFAATPEASVLAFQLLDPASRRPRSFEIPRRGKEGADSPCETSYFISAGCAVKRSVFEALGGMDPSLFYGFEELEFSYRAAASGFRIFYRPDIRVLHRLSRSGRPSWRRVFYFYRNKIWISARYLPWSMVLTQVGLWSGYFLREALRIGRPDVFLAALAAGLSGVPRALGRRRRDRLPPEAIRRLRSIEGRLYY